MQKSAKLVKTFTGICVHKGEIFHKKDDDVYWYSADMEQSFRVPNSKISDTIYVRNYKLYYVAESGLVEFNTLTGEICGLCSDVNNFYGSKFKYPYLYTRDTFINVETGAILASRNTMKMVMAHGSGLAVVINVTNVARVDDDNKADYTLSLHTLEDFKTLYTSPQYSNKTRWYANSDIKDTLPNICRSTSVDIINDHTVRIGDDIIKVREKSTTKPRCVVCHKKLAKCGVVLPCKHCAFHYECIGDIGGNCPQCSGTIADKINTA